MPCRHLFLAPLVLVLASVPGRAQEKVLRELSKEQTEEILQKLKITYKKVPSKRDDVVFYDFEREGHPVRLYWYGGKDLMLDVVFPRIPLEQLNAWNVRAKFSRACLHKEEKGEFAALESNLDLLGGVTEGTVRQFLTTFDEEVKQFAKFVNAGSLDEPTYKLVTAEKLEAILKELKLEFKKTQVKTPGAKGSAVAYDFESNGQKLRLVNFGGEDLMIDAHFKKLPLEDVNQYNVNRPFIRCVAYKVDGKEYTSLEANLDCVGGVSDSILRHFLRTFDEEVKEFSKYAMGK